MYPDKPSNADNHSIKVLTRSKSQAQSIFPGKKVIFTSQIFQEGQDLDICMSTYAFDIFSGLLTGQIIA